MMRASRPCALVRVKRLTVWPLAVFPKFSFFTFACPLPLILEKNVVALHRKIVVSNFPGRRDLIKASTLQNVRTRAVMVTKIDHHRYSQVLFADQFAENQASTTSGHTFGQLCINKAFTSDA